MVEQGITEPKDVYSMVAWGVTVTVYGYRGRVGVNTSIEVYNVYIFLRVWVRVSAEFVGSKSGLG